MSLTSDERTDRIPGAVEPRWRAWPLWATAAGALGVVSTLLTDTRAGGSGHNIDYTVTVADIPGLDHVPFRIGGLTGYLCVAALLVFAAVWQRRVAQRHTWSAGAPVVTFGLVASAGALTLAYGWKGALGDYLHGALEHGAYDDEGLYTYYIMNDFSPYIGWVPVMVTLFALAYMAFRERLVSRGLGGFTGLLALASLVAVAAIGVPGLPFVCMLGLLVAGIWLAVGRSLVTREVV